MYHSSGPRSLSRSSVHPCIDHKYPDANVDIGDDVEEEGPLEPSKPREEVKQDPYPLPKDFEWATVDLTDAAEVRATSISFRNH